MDPFSFVFMFLSMFFLIFTIGFADNFLVYSDTVLSHTFIPPFFHVAHGSIYSSPLQSILNMVFFVESLTGLKDLAAWGDSNGVF